MNNKFSRDNILKQVEILLQEYTSEVIFINMRYEKTPHYEQDKLSDKKLVEFNVKFESFVNKTFAKNHRYWSILNKNDYKLSVFYQGLAKTIKYEVENGEFETFEELLNANLFSDFLEMAEHLLEENYKDPSAVLIGSVLEEHLRKLCSKNSLPLEFANAKGDLKPKKADTLNSDLMTAGIFTKLDQKSVTAWLDLRNKAAHGHYSEYTKEQVALFLQSVRDFLTRFPA
jgi:hypothetical protein